MAEVVTRRAAYHRAPETALAVFTLTFAFTVYLAMVITVIIHGCGVFRGRMSRPVVVVFVQTCFT